MVCLLLPLAVVGMDMLVLRLLRGDFNGLEEEEEEEEDEALRGFAGTGKAMYKTCAMLRFFRPSIPNVVPGSLALHFG